VQFHEVNLKVVVQQLSGLVIPNMKGSMVALVILEPVETQDVDGDKS
jgi:hypothetical protein